MRLKVFDDWKSYIHALLGIFASLTEPIPITMCYLAYQIIEWVEIRDHVLGDIIEYVVGLIIGSIVKLLIHLHM